jgi:hypothetical protein
MNFTPRASALLTHLWVFNPFALQITKPLEHIIPYSYNPLYEGHHTLFQPGDCTSSLIMATHKLVCLGDLHVKDAASFIELLGFAKVGSNPMPVTMPVWYYQRRNTYFSVAKSIREAN